LSFRVGRTQRKEYFFSIRTFFRTSNTKVLHRPRSHTITEPDL
jgi:hypothetical protein